jgi:stalled ribosome rescue protein Dom34
MKKTKCLGIWMDHSNAVLMELSEEKILQRNVVSEDKHDENSKGYDGHEKKLNTKERHRQSEYYRELSQFIRDYKKVVLFGPTDAKSELFNILKTDHLFENISIEMLNADKMSEVQMHSFVKDYFK